MLPLLFVLALPPSPWTPLPPELFEPEGPKTQPVRQELLELEYVEPPKFQLRPVRFEVWGCFWIYRWRRFNPTLDAGTAGAWPTRLEWETGRWR